MNEYDDIIIELEEGEIVTADQITQRVWDPLNLNDGMTRLLNGETGDHGNTVLQDGDELYFKRTSSKRGS